MWELAFEEYGIIGLQGDQEYGGPVAQDFQQWSDYPGGPEDPPPTPEEEFVAEVAETLANTGTGATLDTTDLALLTPDEWEQFVLGLLGFFGDEGHGADQNSYYNDHSDEAPLGEDFIATFGWMPSVQNLPGYHYYDYLTQEMDPELMEVVYASHGLEHSLTSGNVSLHDIEDLPMVMMINGHYVSFSWHSGPPPATGVYTNGDMVVVTGSHGYWTCDLQFTGPDQSLWTSVPIGTDFVRGGFENYPFAGQVTEALQYLSHSPTALALMRAARLNHITVVLDETAESHALGNIVYWNPHSGLMINGLLQSPAMALLHELAHALNWTYQIPHTPDPQYDNSEERRVIVEIETVVAHELGEPSRTSHSGPETTIVYTPSITQHDTPPPPG